MSYPCSVSDNRATVDQIEMTIDRMGTSPILHGTSSPGGAANHAKPASENMTLRRTKAHVRTESLTRKYASTAK